MGSMSVIYSSLNTNNAISLDAGASFCNSKSSWTIHSGFHILIFICVCMFWVFQTQIYKPTQIYQIPIAIFGVAWCVCVCVCVCVFMHAKKNLKRFLLETNTWRIFGKEKETKKTENKHKNTIFIFAKNVDQFFLIFFLVFLFLCCFDMPQNLTI